MRVCVFFFFVFVCVYIYIGSGFGTVSPVPALALAFRGPDCKVVALGPNVGGWHSRVVGWHGVRTVGHVASDHGQLAGDALAVYTLIIMLMIRVCTNTLLLLLYTRVPTTGNWQVRALAAREHVYVCMYIPWSVQALVTAVLCLRVCVCVVCVCVVCCVCCVLCLCVCVCVCVCIHTYIYNMYWKVEAQVTWALVASLVGVLVLGARGCRKRPATAKRDAANGAARQGTLSLLHCLYYTVFTTLPREMRPMAPQGMRAYIAISVFNNMYMSVCMCV